MVLTPSQYENMSKEELIQEFTDIINSNFINDINTKLKNFGRSLSNSHQNMIKFIQSCSNLKDLTNIY